MIIKIEKYVMNPGRFVAGTRGSYGIEKLDFLFSQEWDGLAVSVSFYPLDGDPVAVVYGGVPINIPAEVMNVSGTSRFVVSGYSGERVLITAEGMIRVLDTSVPAENEALVPTPSQVSQIMTALGGKVDKAFGMGLSANDFTDGEKEKLAGIESGAEVNVQPDWNQTDAGAADYVKNKPLLDSVPAAGSGRGVTSGGVYSALAGKAGASHNHDSAYAAKIHGHSETYAPAVHNHSSSYAAINHEHDSRYAAAGHNHDNAYAPLFSVAAGCASNLNPVKHIEVSGILLKRTTAAGETANEIASAELKQLDGMSVVQLIENGNFANASGWEAEGGTLTVSGGIGNLLIDPPETENPGTADYTVGLGGIVSVDGYDTGLQTCEAGKDGIVRITEMANGEGWDVKGLAAGVVTLTVYENGDTVASFTVEVTAAQAGPVEKKVGRAMSFISGHKYYINGEIKSPAKASGIFIFADDGGESGHLINSAADDDWQVVSGIITARATYDGRIGLKDMREVSASFSHTGPLLDVTLDTEAFSKHIGAFSPAASGVYRFVYNGGWKLNGIGQNINISNYGITVSFSTGDESLRAGSVITVTFSYPYARGAAAALTTSGVNGITGLGVNASVFAGALGTRAVSGSYVFKYISGTGWTFNGGSTAVTLTYYGILGTAESQPNNNATITVALTVTEEVIRLRKLTAYDLSVMGMENFTAAEFGQIVGSSYHEKGLTNALAGGIWSAGTEANGFESQLNFSENYELCRLPDGVADRLDTQNGKLYRRITYKTVTAQNGAPVTLDGAKSGTSYLTAGGNVGSVSGTTLTLSKSVSSQKIYYELASPVVTDVALPTSYRAATGGVETLKKYDSASGTYVEAPLGTPAVISYIPDCARQIEADRIKLQGLLVALGIITAADAEVSAAATEISNALAAFIAAQ